ncbi:replication initiator protein [Blackfly microvirus SF02]|uniref:Replication initiator protein n=1 Tax=Blackfly microvirus SF02 TaxID=2576452 RepID=A0A4P8PKE7_9VIRU|nr:replication initiator protein [Blackfly microvirus SF02]
MGCDFPITAYRSREFNPETKRYGMTFNPLKALNSTNSIRVPCGKCQGCRLERSRQWAVRCTHEASLHDQNCFITLTYADPHLPIDYSVHTRDFQLFMKRLRKHAYPKLVRFFACGEYGDQNLRPHYHALLFGFDFEHKVVFETTGQGHKLYLSKDAQALWPFGMVTVGELSYQSASYTARYAMKKISGPMAETHYVRQHPLHGFFCRVQPEFLLMSRGGRDGSGGIGQAWIKKHGPEVFTHDSVIIQGREAQPPRYYFKQLSEEDQHRITTKRQIAAKRNLRPRTFNAEMAHAETRDAKISTLKRKL